MVLGYEQIIAWSSPEISLVYRLPPRMPVTNMVVKGHRTCKHKGRKIVTHLCKPWWFFVRIHCHWPSSLWWPGPSCETPHFIGPTWIDCISSRKKLGGKNILSWSMNVAIPTDFPNRMLWDLCSRRQFLPSLPPNGSSLSSWGYQLELHFHRFFF